MNKASALAAILLVPAVTGAPAMSAAQTTPPTLDKHGERGSVMTYRLAAAPPAVFAAMTRCEELPRWLDAAGRELANCTSDARTGGSFRYEFAAPNGRRFVMFGDFLEVATNQRIVHTEAYRGYDWEPLRVVTTFAPDGAGTALRVEIEYPTAAIRDTDFPNLAQALEGYQRLASYLSRAG